MVEAATELFGEKGWAATGMRDVARAAGVAVETVYANFRSKSELLIACVNVAVVADAEPVPLAQRPAFLALGRGTRAQRVRAAARLLRDIHERSRPRAPRFTGTASGDTELAQWRRTAGGRRATWASVVAHRGASGPARGCDSLWAVMAVEV